MTQKSHQLKHIRTIPSRTLVVIFVLLGIVLSVILYSSRAAQSTTDTAIIFASKQDSATSQVWKMGVNGGANIRLTNDQTAEQEWARPSPDGKQILFMKADKGSSVNFAFTSNRLWVMDANGGNQREIISLAKRNAYGWNGMAHAEWSPDSRKIVLSATLPNFTSQIYVVDANGNSPEQITKAVQIDGQATNVLDPSWSQTNQILFVRSWNCFGVCAKQDVFKIDYPTRVETRVTNDPNWNFDPYMSPDGSTYVWLSFRTSGVACPCDLMRGSVNGSLNPTAIIADGGANANGTFSSDSSKILFLKQVGFKQVLHRINVDGSGLASLAPTQVGETGIASYTPAAATAPSNVSSVTSSITPVPSSGSKKPEAAAQTADQPSKVPQTTQAGSQDTQGATLTLVLLLAPVVLIGLSWYWFRRRKR